MRASSECQALRWKSMTSRMPLREVRLSYSRKRERFKQTFVCPVLYYLFSPTPSSSLFSLSSCPDIGEDPLAGDQNDHDMDSIAGVLKLYFRGLDHALFPKEVFHDLISCVCKSLLLFVCLCECVFLCSIVWVISWVSWRCYFPAMESLQERAVHIKKVLQSLPSKTLIIMRYLFAFLNQWVAGHPHTHTYTYIQRI